MNTDIDWDFFPDTPPGPALIHGRRTSPGWNGLKRFTRYAEAAALFRRSPIATG